MSPFAQRDELLVDDRLLAANDPRGWYDPDVESRAIPFPGIGAAATRDQPHNNSVTAASRVLDTGRLAIQLGEGVERCSNGDAFVGIEPR